MKKPSLSWIFDFLLIVVLIFGAYFRLIGPNWTLDELWLGLTGRGEIPVLVSDWDESQHLHPDERFLTMVSSAISPVTGCSDAGLSVSDCPNSQKQWLSISQYFDTEKSPLNPANRGYTFFVYGTLPLFLVRYVAELTGMTGYDEIALAGRQMSALIDLGSVFLLYLIASRLYGRRVGLLAAAFSALAVMPIQQSHFYTVDNFPTFFMLLSAYFALDVAQAGRMRVDGLGGGWEAALRGLLTSRLFRASIFFGLATGMAMASKLNAAPVAGLLPLALLIHFWKSLQEPEDFEEPEDSEGPDEREEPDESDDLEEPEDVEISYVSPASSDSASSVSSGPSGSSTPSTSSRDYLWTLAGFLVLGAFFTIIAFRIFQPYAFSGPGFFGFLPNPAWVQTISEQRMQASGDVDFPPALQWARRSATYSFENLVSWGLGLPLGLLAFAGLAYMGWRIIRGEAQQHLLLWFWTLAYFLWQSMEWNPTMRYQLPIYPLLAMMAAWLVFNGPRWRTAQGRTNPLCVAFYGLLGAAVLASTFAWAHAFTRIYTRDHARVQATRWIYQNVPGPLNVRVVEDGKVLQQPLPFQRGFILTPATPLVTQFNAKHSGQLRELTFAHALDSRFVGSQVVTFTISKDYTFEPDAILASATVQDDFSAPENSRGKPYTVRFDTTARLEAGQDYHLRIETDGELTFSGSVVVSETDWDDGLPLRMDGYDGYGGIYEGGLKFQAYWDDNEDKLQLFYEALDGGDYLFISSNRQWGTTTRVPKRYPLTTAFYYALLGCPADADVLNCYATARPGDYQGILGYELIQVFDSYPTLDLGDFGSWEFNNQLADEAFTVYDHPKVLLFKKSESYDPQVVRDILSSVDLTQVIRLTPRRAADFPGGDMTPRVCLDQAGLCHLLGAPEAAQLTGQGLGTASFGMMFSPERYAVQRAGGDWNALFSYDYLQNRFPVLGLLLWYLFLFVLGVVTYPLLRLLMPGLRDGGYPLARFAGLMLLAWLAWFGASLGSVYTRTTISMAFGLIIALGLLSARYQRESLREEIRTRGRYFLVVEALFLAFFLVDLFIRIGNPDLWHPAKGGERPMDFAYFNAVLKSTTFPPYDPWFAGGYINYYYYGFVLVGTPVKLLALTPSIAYNFLLPSLFAMLALGGFSAAWNLFDRARKQQDDEEETAFRFFDGRLMAGFGAAVGLVLVGNLGTIRTIYQALQKLAVGNETFNNPDVWIPQRWGWALQGFFKTLTGNPLPVPTGEWYWNPSRVLPPGSGNEITEFPLFTFIYSDLHAHMIALPIMTLAVAWAVSTLFARGLSPKRWLATLAFGGLVIGALRPTNTWDFPTYLALGAIVTLYAFIRYAEIDWLPLKTGLPPILLRGLLGLAAVGALVFFALALYQPYAQWFGLGYSEVNRWEGSRTPIWSYWTHWGLFLYVIILWMGWETVQWLAQTPLSALKKLKPYVTLIELSLVAFLVALGLIMFVGGAKIAWFILPLAAWALLLILRPNQPEAKRMALFLIGTALAITLFVELFALSGDLGRMNTIFKLYMQAWVLFAIAAGLALASTLADLDGWTPGWRKFWQTGLLIFFSAAFLFTLTGSFDKMRDRMAAGVPLTLDSMEFMAHATYWDGEEMDLSQDYRAIRWLQANVPASPVIVEGHAPEYRWGSRFSIYTGLPSVIGWNWHQRQQRTLTPDTWVWSRVNDVRDFYETADIAAARAFLEKYDARYIIVGQMERNYYVPGGLLKFETYEGRLWREVYRDGETVIYEVIP
jgi:YYY domain-containing protein